MRWFAVMLAATLVGACSGDPSPGTASERGEAVAASDASPAGGQRFANVALVTHEGKTVRFYDDLVKGKIVAINFMYATCTER